MAAKQYIGASQSTRSSGWEDLTDTRLLELRFRDLRLRIDESFVWPEVQRLYADLERRGFRFKPHIWLSTEWFSPDGVPGIAVPFFTAHPRLLRLERRMTGQVEGGSSKWRLRILRHEAGHAFDTAYGLRRRGDWREVFGPASKPYRRDYSVRPGSRRFVLHLGDWYAQSHPTEDFAETFAVWLQPKARWRREYAGWPALQKLEYVDGLMDEIARRAPRNRDRSVIEPLAENNRSLAEHYRRMATHSEGIERRYDAWLERELEPRHLRPDAVPAGRFVRGMATLRGSLILRTGASSYLVDHVVEALARRARELDLVVPDSPRDDGKRRVLSLHEAVIRDVLRRNKERFVL